MNYELVGVGGWWWKLTGLYINSFVSNTIALPLNRIINRKKNQKLNEEREKKIKLEKEKEKDKERKNERTNEGKKSEHHNWLI